MVASSTPGAQVVSRVAAILRVVSEASPAGITTSEVVQRTALTRQTAHRLLASLATEGFVDRGGARGTWFVGPEIYIMGAVAADAFNITELALDSVRAVARLTGESAFLSARRGDETVCLKREEGSFPIRSFVLHEGIRFPLGVASAGIAILAHMPKAEVDEYLNRALLASAWGEDHSASSLRIRVDETRRAGYSVNPGLIVEGSWGMGAAIFDRNGRPQWALSVTGVEPRFRAERLPILGRILLEHAHEVTRRLQARAEMPRG